MKKQPYKLWFTILVILTSSGNITWAQEQPYTAEYSVRTPIPARNLKLEPSGNEYYVTTNGNDQYPGTKGLPFRTIQKCVDMIQPGDICMVREGTYRETVRPKNGG